MKITKKKWETQQPLFFYRDTISGKLTEQENREQDFTENLFKQPNTTAVFETSIKTQLLKSCDKGKKFSGDKCIAELVASLCEDVNLNETLNKIKPLSLREAEKRCNETLSGYGKHFTTEGNSKTLYEVLLQLMTGNEMQKAFAKAELERIQESLLREKANRIARVRTSIKENKMPFKVKDDSITPNTERAKWLLDLLRKGGEYPTIDVMENNFSFETLSEEIISKIDKRNKPQAITKKVDEFVRAYCQGLWEKYPGHQRDMKYYFQTVHEYFRENFPIRAKSKGASERQKQLNEKIDRLLEPKHMKNAVRRKLINQSTQIHILYGKLFEYCYNTENPLPVNSDTLQKIQVLEAVKKQFMTAILWSISRLQYFYQYYNGDILSNKPEIKKFRKNFLSSNTEANLQVCREKLQAFFPLENNADREHCTALLEACADCIRELRIRIFHYKNLNLIMAVEQAAENIKCTNESAGSLSILKQLYKQDIEHLQDAFVKRLSSMNLPLYYRKDTLTAIFAKSGISFSLYSANNQMTPSFRRIYERGKNLRNDTFYKLRWYTQLEDRQETSDADAQRAIRNLLKLIYDYAFLPAVQKDETLVTSHIPEVFSRNKRFAHESSRPKAAGYSKIQELYSKGMKLSELMKLIQRQISQTEQDNRKLACDKTDYAQRFIREVYAVAFNSFMDTKCTDLFSEITSPQKDSTAAKVWVEKLQYEKDNLPHLHTSLTEDADNYLLVLYPILRLLDSQELSEFKQQMLRYRTSMTQWQGEADLSKTIIKVTAIEELAELIKLTEPIPVNTEEVWRNKAENIFKPFVEGSMLSDYGDFYLQSDNFTPVFRRNMTRLQRTGVLKVYKEVLGDQKQATKKDYQTVCTGLWVMQSSDGRYITFVEYVQCELQRLHRNYEENPNKFPSKDYKTYRSLLNWLENYNHAQRNMTFETLYRVCRIHLEMMSRWVGFAQDWERDMYYLLLAWVKQGKLKYLSENDVKNIFTNGVVVGNLKKKLKKEDLSAFLSVYRSGTDKNLNFAKVRNDIAHLDLLRSSNWTLKNDTLNCSVIEQYLNRLRMLLSYDQKRMNAITKTMQKIFEENKIIAVFSMESGAYVKFDKLRPMPIEHLKNLKSKPAIKIDSHGKTFLQTLETLMKYP